MTLDTSLDAGPTVMPASERELSACLSRGRESYRVEGGGSRPAGNPVSAHRILSTAALSGIRLYEPGALTLVAAAGTPMAEVEAALAAERQMLPFEPMDHRPLLRTRGPPTIGGAVATAAAGPRMVQAGRLRDSLIGVRFVDGSGNVVSNGGRVMKNVTGYDLVKLMAGSFGTLGVLTEVAFKLQPMPETTATLIAEGLDDAEAVRAMTAALSTPFEVSGAAHGGFGRSLSRVTLLRLEGFAESVAYRAGALRKRLAPYAAFEIEIETEPARAAAIWRDVRDLRPFADSDCDVWRLTVRATEASRLVAQVPDADAHYDHGGARVWLGVPAGKDLRAALGGFEGRATLVRAAPETRRALGAFQPQPPGTGRLAAALRAQFDPAARLNPGIMG